MLTYRTGVASSPASGPAMAQYLLAEGLRTEDDARARYYAGEFVPEQTAFDRLARQIWTREITFPTALALLMAEEVRGGTKDLEGAERRLTEQLRVAMEQLDQREAFAEKGGTVAVIRADLRPRMAKLLAIHPSRPLTEGEIGFLLNGLRADGRMIEGKEVHQPMRSVVDVFGLDATRLPTPAEVEQVLAGRRADGQAPLNRVGGLLAAEAVAGARGRFLAAYGMPSRQEPSDEQVAHIKTGRTVTGLEPNAGDVLRKLTATREPISYVDLVWSPDKSVSIAWALAPTEGERAAILHAHKDAVGDAMGYVEERLGFTRKGKSGKDGVEPGTLGWMLFHHYTARPLGEVIAADPQLHTHSTLLNAVLTDSGRVGSLDLDQLDGLVRELGATYQAFLARNLRRHGIEVALDAKTGAARITAIPQHVRDHFSKRSMAAEDLAREFAADRGLEWDTLSPEQKIALQLKSVQESRLRKNKNDGPNDFESWRSQASEIGYHHRSVLRPDEIKPERSMSERRQVAYETSLSLIEDALSRRAKLGGQEMREFAARGLVEAGIDNAGTDISAVTKAYRELGVTTRGQGCTAHLGERRADTWQDQVERHNRDARGRRAGADRGCCKAWCGSIGGTVKGRLGPCGSRFSGEASRDRSRKPALAEAA